MENQIEINPGVMVGKPVIKGTRITVELILEKIAVGESFEAILAEYPHLSREEVASAVRFALEAVRQDFPALTENQGLLDTINKAYEEPIDPEESRKLRLMKNRSTENLDEWK